MDSSQWGMLLPAFLLLTALVLEVFDWLGTVRSRGKVGA